LSDRPGGRPTGVGVVDEDTAVLRDRGEVWNGVGAVGSGDDRASDIVPGTTDTGTNPFRRRRDDRPAET